MYPNNPLRIETVAISLWPVWHSRFVKPSVRLCRSQSWRRTRIELRTRLGVTEDVVHITTKEVNKMDPPVLLPALQFQPTLPFPSWLIATELCARRLWTCGAWGKSRRASEFIMSLVAWIDAKECLESTKLGHLVRPIQSKDIFPNIIPLPITPILPS